MIKGFIELYKEFKVWLAEWLYYKKLSIRLSLAIQLADIKQRAFNRQYHIMIMETCKGEKLVSVCREDLKRFKRLKWIPKDFSMFDLIHSKSVFYSTPVALNNRSTAEERKKAKEKYFRYRGIIRS